MRVKLNEDKKRETIVVSAINRPPAILPPGVGNDCESLSAKKACCSI